MLFKYSLKRFLVSIPVIWLLITVVFLLSRLLPGTYGAESIQSGEGNTYNKSTQQQRDKAYQAYLHKTGQDLPAFYFSIGSQANSSHKKSGKAVSDKLVEQLTWQFGNEQKALSYYNRLTNLKEVLEYGQHQEQLPLLYKIQNTLIADSILYYSQFLIAQLPAGKAKTYSLQLEQAAKDLTQNTSAFKYLLPALQWHGANNQYHTWLLQLIKGDMGKSYKDARPVAGILWEAVTNTFWLILLSMAVTFILALELSIIMVRKSRISWKKILMPGLYFADSIPLFVLSLLLLILFATPDFFPVFPVFGLGYQAFEPMPWYTQFLQTMPFLILPVICLVLANLPYLTNQLYRALADTMQSDFIRTARSKGLKERSIIRKHALRNALLPVITVLSDFLPALVAGSVVIETIFAIPGIGRLLITSVFARDFPVILGIVLLVALVKMASHFVADICYTQADPRVRKAVSA